MNQPASPPRWLAVVAVLGAAALFGTTGTTLAKAPESATALGAGSLRLTIGSIGLLLIARGRLGSLRGSRLSICVGGLWVAAYQLSFFWATTNTGVAMATVVTIAVSPVMSWLIGRVRRRPSPPVGWYLATGVVIAGLVLLVFGGSDSAEFSGVGVAAAVIAGASFSAYTEAGSVALARGADSTATMAGLFGVGAVASWCVLPFQPLAWVATGRGIIVLFVLGVVTLTVAYVAFGVGLRSLNPSTVVVLTIVEPLVASLLAVTVLHEKLSTVGWVGAALIVGGVVVVASATRDATQSSGDSPRQ